MKKDKGKKSKKGEAEKEPMVLVPTSVIQLSSGRKVSLSKVSSGCVALSFIRPYMKEYDKDLKTEWGLRGFTKVENGEVWTGVFLSPEALLSVGLLAFQYGKENMTENKTQTKEENGTWECKYKNSHKKKKNERGDRKNK
jgi:hypothetical protein